MFSTGGITKVDKFCCHKIVILVILPKSRIWLAAGHSSSIPRIPIGWSGGEIAGKVAWLQLTWSLDFSALTL